MTCWEGQGDGPALLREGSQLTCSPREEAVNGIRTDAGGESPVVAYRRTVPCGKASGHTLAFPVIPEETLSNYFQGVCMDTKCILVYDVF